MMIFNELEKAFQAGFHWVEYLPHHKLHLIERIFTRADGLKVRALAYARAESPERAAPSS